METIQPFQTAKGFQLFFCCYVLFFKYSALYLQYLSISGGILLRGIAWFRNATLDFSRSDRVIEVPIANSSYSMMFDFQFFINISQIHKIESSLYYYKYIQRGTNKKYSESHIYNGRQSLLSLTLIQYSIGIHMRKKMKDGTFTCPLLFTTTHLLYCLAAQSLITLTPSPLATSVVPITIFNSSSSPALNANFVQDSASFNCSLSTLYTYKQTFQQYTQNSAYSLTFQGFSGLTSGLTISVSTWHSSIDPLLNLSKTITCDTIPCIISVQNNCHLPNVNYLDYFDVVRLNITGFSTIISYYVLCNSNFQGNTFQFGLLIQIVFCTLLITIVALYSNAWSIGGAGFRISLPLVIIFNAILIIGGIVAVFKFQVVAISVNVLSWIFGLATVWLCSNQLIFLLKRFSILRKQIVKIKTITIRVLDLISAIVSLGICFGWWFSNKNWIMNDVIAICVIIAAMKVLKFTSLKQALVCFCVTITVEMIFVLILTFQIRKSYNTVILNIFNNPFELQIPTINPVYNQKCAWLPVTALIYPGALMSYMRRFDSSRNTNVYIVTCVVVFLIGSFCWMFISILSADSWPYGLVAEPATLGLISFFAWKRKQIRTLWSGKFYDEEFAHKQGLKSISQSIQRQRKDTKIVYNSDLFTGLHYNQDDSQMEHSQMQSRSRVPTKIVINHEQSRLDQRKSPTFMNMSLLSQSSDSSAQGDPTIQLQNIRQISEISSKNQQKQKIVHKINFPMAITKGAI